MFGWKNINYKITVMTSQRKQQRKDRFTLFATGFTQVYFVAINTYFLAKEIYVGVLLASFAISLIWSFNVKKVAFGSMADRLTYATGAALGAVTGLATSATITNILNKIL